MITDPNELATRPYTVWGGLRTVWYSQESTNSPTDHRDDCSGFASAVLGLPTPGLSTVGLPSVLLEIPRSDVRPGDLAGIMGPGTEGDDGHVVVITKVSANSITFVDQGGGLGPNETTVKRLPAGYAVYRAPAPDPPQEDDDMIKGMICTIPGAGVLAWTDPILGPVYRDIVSWDYADAYAAAGWSRPGPDQSWEFANATDLGQEFSAAQAAYYDALRASQGGGIGQHVHDVATTGPAVPR